MDKYDVKKVHKGLYAPSAKEFTVVEVPEFRYLTVDGSGDPNTSAAYVNAVEALYGVAYTLKFASKKTLGRDFVVGPLEGAVACGRSHRVRRAAQGKLGMDDADQPAGLDHRGHGSRRC
jgi:hypothetical protein